MLVYSYISLFTFFVGMGLYYGCFINIKARVKGGGYTQFNIRK